VARVRRSTTGISFRCPGCGDVHVVPTRAPTGARWDWNESLDRPTLVPSIAIASGHYASSWRPGDECWCGKDYGHVCYRCHSSVTSGRIFFHTDSTHALAGQTADLPDVDSPDDAKVTEP
jgi:hypothetical protein